MGLRAKVVDPLTDFLDDEVLGGLLLLIAAVVAVAWANSPWSDAYFDLWHTHVAVAGIDLDLHGWVNDLLMAVFFFVVGMEIKRELVTGELRDPRTAALPAVAAAGGVLLPALIYLLVVSGSDGDAARGWAIPAATDIAFAVGVLALLGARVAAGVRLFLLSIAIVDDLIAIAIIAVVYSAGLSAGWFAVAIAAVAVVVLLQRLGVARPLAYVLPAALLWVAVYESGVHATIAGVLLGLLMPARPFRGRDVHSAIEHRIHPLSAYVIVPLFALANAGVDFRDGVLGEALSEPVTWAVAGGLVVGKLAGISAATLVALKLRAGRLPAGMARGQVVGVGALGGIGFTVALFVADLAFDDPALTDAAKVGIFIASIAAGTLGTLLLLARRRGGAAEG
ncbi:Na+/H+ antiporter NhaA [Conexibacter sp. JD483]|uniref:Na+/H+ antiporter NhaA n=1 Tax=unclassified Conexibacter TaxID=2627773 RepID=UPI0027171C8C|nr:MULTISPECIES: Na+/H+ antiporter NhaA [unclassified Conexibacter]MDO8185227.1 Na+/H+ antiporter NhaA [Conexibacter sp. CPCC 205706]MDO8198273.1 Na+/H+ antiporter NhaA [Conexibacter sp. CPCC 205762]MDR9367765.1 Na+/H+ antiporter NhaA [Conexibacter sp. JD483]